MGSISLRLWLLKDGGVLCYRRAELYSTQVLFQRPNSYGFAVFNVFIGIPER